MLNNVLRAGSHVGSTEGERHSSTRPPCSEAVTGVRFIASSKLPVLHYILKSTYIKMS